jgi:hypothetical protein
VIDIFLWVFANAHSSFAFSILPPIKTIHYSNNFHHFINLIKGFFVLCIK